MESQLLPAGEPLFQNKNWSIEQINETEIAITDGWRVMYAAISADKSKLVCDVIIAPQYILNVALRLAKRNLKSIYK